MWTSHDLIVVAHTAVVALILCLVAFIASDVRAGEGMTFGAAVRQPRESIEQQAVSLTRRPRDEPASSLTGSDWNSI